MTFNMPACAVVGIRTVDRQRHPSELRGLMRKLLPARLEYELKQGNNHATLLHRALYKGLLHLFPYNEPKTNFQVVDQLRAKRKKSLSLPAEAILKKKILAVKTGRYWLIYIRS
ncbi:MAG: hypothetical protein EOO38_29505 [Cytophagaceae bacterium]|nr:MAG: hypothetical protein EOO38_29505 [Cytophagaceae bacterium]